MVTATGKRARKTGGNRHSIKKNKRRVRNAKRFTNNVLSPDEYRRQTAT